MVKSYMSYNASAVELTSIGECSDARNEFLNNYTGWENEMLIVTHIILQPGLLQWISGEMGMRAVVACDVAP